MAGSSTYFPQRRFESGDVPGFDANYYLSNNPDVGNNYSSWSRDLSSLHYADYVRTSRDLEKNWSSNYDKHKQARWAWGEGHWDRHGKNEPGRIRPLVVGGRQPHPGDTRTIWTGTSIPDSKERADFAAWHYDAFGRDEGRFKSEADWYNSPGQQQERQNKFQADLLAQQQASAAEMARIQEEMAAQAARVKGNSPTGVGGAASIKGSRLSMTQSGGRKGTKQFSRPTQYLNTLGIGSGGTANRSPQHTL